MKKWIVFLIILLALNGIMAVTYVKKRNQVIKLYHVLQEEPTLNDYVGISNQTRGAVAYDLKDKNPTLGSNFINVSEQLDRSIKKMEANPPHSERWKDFYKPVTNEPGLGDSLWSSWAAYRDAVQNVSEENAKVRTRWKQIRQQAMSIYVTNLHDATGKNLKARKSWDSLTHEIFWNRISVKDTVRVAQFMHGLNDLGDMGGINYVNNLLAKGDAFFMTRGKVNLYGHTYAFAGLTPYETRMLMRHLIVLKGSVDGQVAKILNVREP